MQGGPPTPEQMRILLDGIIPIVGMFTGIVITGFVALGPVGRAIGRVIMHIFNAEPREPGLKSGDTEEIIARLDTIQSHISEISERQDFSERMLAQVRREKVLPGETDVQR
jgi:hypothetical protein